VGIAAGKRELRRPRHRWEDNIKVGLKKTGLWREGGISSWIHLLGIGTGGRLLWAW
jgi:hypothetical protein